MELNQELTEGLPFDERQQAALLGYILSDLNFFLLCSGRVKANWFVDGWTGKAYDLWQKFHATFGHEPKSDEEFFLFEEVYVLPPLERQKIKNTIIRSRAEKANFSLDVLQASLTGWLQSRVYHQYVSQSATLFNARKFSAAKGVLATAVKELQEISFDGTAPADFGNPGALVEQVTTLADNALTFGHPVFDKILGPDCKIGSLLPGDSTVFLAPTNVGKSTVKLTVMCSNILAGKSAILMVHEGRELDIMERIWQCILRCTKSEYRALAMSDDSNVRAQLGAIAKILKDRLVYIHHQKPGNNVEDVVAMIRQHQERRKALTGKGFDLLIDDYPAILGSSGTGNLRQERRHKDAYVYRYFVDYAGEQGMHGLFSIQTNREGSKKNRKVGEYYNKNFLVSLEDVQEAYEVTNSATNLITINRSPEDQARDVITFLLCKSRSSEVNVAVSCRSDFKRARSHDPQLSAIWWRGTESLDQLDSLLSTYNSQEVPYNYKDLQNGTERS